MDNFQSGTLTIADAFVNTARVTGEYIPRHGEAPVVVTASDSVTVDAIKTDIKKAADKKYAKAGDVISYTVTFKNQSSVDMFNCKVIDNISPWTTLVAGSIKPTPATGETLASGVTIGDVLSGKEKTLTFKVMVNHDVGGDIINSAYANFTFTDSSGYDHSIYTETVTATTSWVAASISLLKTANKNFITFSGEEIVYSLLVTNNSSGNITDLMVTDVFPEGMTYKANSTLRNDTLPYTNENPENGIHIGSLTPNQSYKISFTAIARF